MGLPKQLNEAIEPWQEAIGDSDAAEKYLKCLAAIFAGNIVSVKTVSFGPMPAGLAQVPGLRRGRSATGKSREIARLAGNVVQVVNSEMDQLGIVRQHIIGDPSIDGLSRKDAAAQLIFMDDANSRAKFASYNFAHEDLPRWPIHPLLLGKTVIIGTRREDIQREGDHGFVYYEGVSATDGSVTDSGLYHSDNAITSVAKIAQDFVGAARMLPVMNLEEANAEIQQRLANLGS